MTVINSYIPAPVTDLETVTSITTTGTVNPLAITNERVLVWTGSSDLTISGISAPTVNGYSLTIRNNSSINNAVIIINESSTNANSVLLGFGTNQRAVIARGQEIVLYYDLTASRWRAFNAEPFRAILFPAANLGLAVLSGWTGRTTLAVAPTSERYYMFDTAVPIFCRQLITEVTTAVAGATYNIDIYEYSNSGTVYATGATLFTSGNISAATAGQVVTTPTTACVLRPGTYWLRFVSSNAAAQIRGILNPDVNLPVSIGPGAFTAVGTTIASYTGAAVPNTNLLSPALLAAPGPLCLFRG
jgi:hypothetical protein